MKVSNMAACTSTSMATLQCQLAVLAHYCIAKQQHIGRTAAAVHMYTHSQPGGSQCQLPSTASRRSNQSSILQTSTPSANQESHITLVAQLSKSTARNNSNDKTVCVCLHSQHSMTLTPAEEPAAKMPNYGYTNHMLRCMQGTAHSHCIQRLYANPTPILVPGWQECHAAHKKPERHCRRGKRFYSAPTALLEVEMLAATQTALRPCVRRAW
jgi:hypothetical protein